MVKKPDVPVEVLLVSKPVTTGAPDGTVALVRALSTRGETGGCRVRYHVPVPFRVGAPAPDAHARLAALPPPFERVAWRPLALLNLLSAPRQLIRHYFFTPTPRVVRMLRRVERRLPGPCVQTFCSTPADEVPLAPLAFADYVVALSRHTRDRLLADGLAPHRVHHIPPAIPMPPHPTESLRREIRQRLGLAPQTPLVLYLGDYDRAEAALNVARALPRILAHTAAHAVLACRPKGAKHAEIARTVRSLLGRRVPNARRVHLLGTISWADDLAAAADLALFPAKRLPDKMDLPVALLESLAAGVPAVVADQGPLAELVTDGAALGVPAGAPERLADAAIGLLEHAEKRHALGTASREWCRQSYARLGAAHATLYQQVTEERASRP